MALFFALRHTVIQLLGGVKPEEYLDLDISIETLVGLCL